MAGRKGRINKIPTTNTSGNGEKIKVNKSLHYSVTRRDENRSKIRNKRTKTLNKT